MENFRLGYDDNLGLPNDFVQKIPCELASYHDLGLLIEAFETNKLDAIFIPAGTLPYVEKYEMISQSLFGKEQTDTLQTNFVTAKDITLQNIASFTLGRVNKYCTTSYWAPQIYLMQHLPKGTKLNFQNTNGFVDMLDKTAQGKVDGSMVWDIILQEDTSPAKKVHELFYLNGLPTPVIVAHKKLSAELSDKINQFKSADANWFFRGFQQPNLSAIEKFQQDIKNAVQFYNIDLKK